MLLDKSTLLKYYKRRDIQEILIAQAKDKEIGLRYGDRFGKRPDILSYPQDVLEIALRGGTSFHASEERWFNPLCIRSEMSRKELDEHRRGWDLVLDIDCAVIEYSLICAELIGLFLIYCDCPINSFSIKFSGNKGFHIGLPFEAFPHKVGDTDTRLLFPEAPRKIAAYVRDNVKDALAKRIMDLEGGDISRVSAKVNLPVPEIIRYEHKNGQKTAMLNVEKFLEIDTVLLSSRHLYRMAYSFHEKSGLVSLPFLFSDLSAFQREHALPGMVQPPFIQFIDRNIKADCARRLLIQALDYETKTSSITQPAIKKTSPETILTTAISKDLFPPCMKKIGSKLPDGKKRALFCILHYLGKIGWTKEQITVWAYEWNSLQNEPLKEVYLKGQLTHFIAGQKLPPNCTSEPYYRGIGVCEPDSFCRKIKNPVNYTLLKYRNVQQQQDDRKINHPQTRQGPKHSRNAPQKNTLPQDHNPQDNHDHLPVSDKSPNSSPHQVLNNPATNDPTATKQSHRESHNKSS